MLSRILPIVTRQSSLPRRVPLFVTRVNQCTCQVTKLRFSTDTNSPSPSTSTSSKKSSNPERRPPPEKSRRIFISFLPLIKHIRKLIFKYGRYTDIRSKCSAENVRITITYPTSEMASTVQTSLLNTTVSGHDLINIELTQEIDYVEPENNAELPWIPKYDTTVCITVPVTLLIQQKLEKYGHATFRPVVGLTCAFAQLESEEMASSIIAAVARKEFKFEFPLEVTIGNAKWQPSNTSRTDGSKKQTPHQRTNKTKGTKEKTSVPTPAPQSPDLDPTLPPAWRTAVDASTGRTYYWHTTTRQTTWDRPTA